MSKHLWKPIPKMLLLLTAVIGAACTDTPEEAAGQGTAQAINAISDVSSVEFLIEETRLETVLFLRTTPFNIFDALEYDFNFDYLSGVTGDQERLASITQTLDVNTAYTFVLHGTAAAPRVTVLQQPERDFDVAGTILEIWFSNFSTTASAVDFYLGQEGFDPATVAPLATGITQTTASGTVEIEAQSGEFVVTEAGNPAAVLFRSEPTGVTAGETLLVTLLDASEEVLGDYALSVGGTVSTGLVVDNSALPQAQFTNASFSSGPVDFFQTSDLQNALASNVGPGQITTPVVLPDADDGASFGLTVTPAGNPGVILEEREIVFPDAQNSIVFFSGRQADDSTAILNIPSNQRVVFDATRLGIFNGIEDADAIEFFLLEEDEEFETERPQAALESLRIQSEAVFPPESFDMLVVDFFDQVTRTDRIPLDLLPSTIVWVITLDTADPGVSEIVVLDPLNP
ncbi:MAG: hypothetical protein AAF578_15455 [Pseudomonadota bacterium]